MGPIEMPFGMFDYLVDLTKFPKFHRASPIGRGPTRGRSTQVDSCRFLILLLFFFLELVYRSESARESKFFAPEGRDPINTHTFVIFALLIS